MESRWYVPRGKKLEETRIEDRQHQLHVSKDNWHKIIGHMDKKRLHEEALQNEEDKRRAMKEASEAMTKTWANSLENLRRDKENERLTEKQDENYMRYLELKKDQEDERRIYVEKMRARMMQKKDYPKALNTALLYSEVIYEREKQIELQNKIKEVNKEIERKHSEAMQNNVASYFREEDEKQRRLSEQHKKYLEELECQKQENIDRINAERQEQLETELLQNERAQREIEHIKETAKEQLLAKRAQFVKDNDEFRDYKAKHNEKLKKEEAEIDTIIQIIGNSKKRIATIRKEKEKLDIEQRAQRSELISSLIRTDNRDREREAKEEASRLKAIAEHDAKTELRAQQDLANKERIKKEIEESWTEHLKHQQRVQREEKERLKWEMLNRFKHNEVHAGIQREAKQRIFEREMEKKTSWDKQIAERNSLIAAEKQREREERKQHEMHMQKEDEDYMKYSEEVLQHAKQRGRNTLPIQKVVSKYKESTMFIEKPNNFHHHLKSCTNPEHLNLVNVKPGMMAHDPKTDPYFAHPKRGNSLLLNH